MDILSQISESLQKGSAKLVAAKTTEALEESISPSTILNDGLLAGMSVIGKKFKNNEVYVPEVLIAARAMHAGLNVLKPKLIETGVKPIGKVILGTVKGDLHDIGKNLVNGGYSITKTNYPSLARICLIGKNLNTENLRQKLLLG